MTLTATRATAFFRGEGGAVWEMDLPLSEPMLNQVKSHKLLRVNEDGSTFQEISEPTELEDGEEENTNPEDDADEDEDSSDVEDDGDGDEEEQAEEPVQEVSAKVSKRVVRRKV